MISNWTLVFRYVALGSLAFSTGPLLVPFFVHTDPIIALHAQTPDAVTISGWYGPGAWIAFVLTSLSAVWRVLHMSWHMMRDHTYGRSSCETCTERYQDQWDADLLVSLVYTSFATVDVMQHCLRILRADPPSLEPSVLPAMQASATATYVGCGLSHVVLVPLAIAGIFEYIRGKSTLDYIRAHQSRLLVSSIMLIVTYVGVITCERSQAAIFIAHNELAPTLTFWPSGAASTIFSVADFGLHPLTLSFLARYWATIWAYVPLGYMGGLVIVYNLTPLQYFKFWALFPTIAVVTWFMPLVLGMFVLLIVVQVCHSIQSRSNSLPIIILQPAIIITMFWPAVWLSLTPGSGFFPYSSISLTELDQLGTLVTMLVVSTLRLSPWIAQDLLGRNRTTPASRNLDEVELLLSDPNVEEAS
jgi:hypothetical protein